METIRSLEATVVACFILPLLYPGLQMSGYNPSEIDKKRNICLLKLLQEHFL